jgi:16S rRNA (guanine527-N7)-methyltransferase
VDKSKLSEGARHLQIALSDAHVLALEAFVSELSKWNQKFNLTAITSPNEVLEKHLLDSLLAARFMPVSGTFLDFGSGAGLPGIPLAVVCPGVSGTLVDAVEKKVAFMRVGALKAGVSQRLKCLHVRLAGQPEVEHLECANVVISRAFMDVTRFLNLAKPYLLPGGSVVAMLGKAQESALRVEAAQAGCRLAEIQHFELPFSKDPRAIAVFHVEHQKTESA